MDAPAMNIPCMIVCMGVSGAGKSTLARALAETLSWRYVEADTFHSRENRQQMASGKALTDAQRGPWMETVCRELEWLAGSKNSCVLAHSGLRAAHREQLRHCGFDARFLHLTGPTDLIERRLAHRPGHFMSPTLLHSQLDALQPTEGEADVIALDVRETPDALHDRALAVLSEYLSERATP